MRLIDADELTTITDIREDGTEFTYVSQMEIEEAPTAYDIDKVVEELEELKKRNPFIDNAKDNSFEASVSRQTLDYAIEIVKAGGKNE